MRWYILCIFETATFKTNEAGQRVKAMRKQEKDEEVHQDRLANLCIRRG
jgi:hypothetical protein